MTISDELRALADEAAIGRLLNRYARGVDRRDWDLIRSCYHPDASDDRGPGPDRYRGGIDGLLEWMRAALEPWITMHLLANRSIEINGDRAGAETYCMAWHRSRTSALQRFIPVRYADRLDRRNGEWRIAARVCVYEPGWETTSAAPLAPLGVPGLQNRNDPTYRALGLDHDSEGPA